MTIESRDLNTLRETTSRVLVTLAWLHLPIAVAIGLLRGEAFLAPAAVIAVMAAAATASWRLSGSGAVDPPDRRGRADGRRRRLRLRSSTGIPGRPTCTCISSPRWRAWSPIATSARSWPARWRSRCIISTLNFILPAAIYPGGADFGRVVLHAVILLIEAGVLIWLAFKLSRAVRRPWRRRPPKPRPPAPPKPAPAPSGSTPRRAPSRSATRRGANSPPSFEQQGRPLSSRRSPWPPRVQGISSAHERQRRRRPRGSRPPRRRRPTRRRRACRPSPPPPKN